jgi:cytochrome c556
MKIVRIAAAAALVLLAAQAPGDQVGSLHALMKTVVAPQANTLWDVGNRAMDDNGNADPARIKPADWAALSTAGKAMKDASLRMAAASRIVVAAPGETLQNDGQPGAITVAQMQRIIDGDPKGFADHARELAAVSDEFVQSAATRDAARLTAASGRLDEVCESCHTRFWYPEQPEPK